MKSKERKEKLLKRMKGYAYSKGLEVGWFDVEERFTDEYRDLPYHRRRELQVDFETWITRQRHPDKLMGTTSPSYQSD